MGRRQRRKWKHYVTPQEVDLSIKTEYQNHLVYLCHMCLQTFMTGRDLKFHKEQCRTSTKVKKSYINILDLKWLVKLESFQLLRRVLQKSIIAEIENLKDFNKISINDLQKVDFKLDDSDIKNEIQEMVKSAPKITNRDGKVCFKCEKCGKLYTTKHMLRLHLNAHYGIKAYKCPKCGLGISQKGGLITHLRVHSGIRPYQCKICHKRFSQPVSAQHMCTHSGEKRFRCNLCPSLFGSVTVLKTHRIAKHSFLRPFQCEICMKTFADKDYLKKHKTLHRAVKPYPCTVCPKSFITKSNLQRHLLIHSGSTPYCCNQCGKQYNNQGSLKYHLTTHLKDRLYKCGLCRQELSTKQNLNNHLKRHQERNDRVPVKRTQKNRNDLRSKKH